MLRGRCRMYLMKTTQPTNNATTDDAVYALVRSLKDGAYGPGFSHFTYTAAEQRGLIRWTVDGYRAV